jgi:hypothetical protein
MFVVAVIIDGYDTAADVGVLANRRVAEIAQMARLGAAPQPRLLGFHEIADTVMAFKLRAGPEVGKRTDFAVLAYAALLGAHAQLEM